jgi:hypothetical protein
MRGLLEQVIVGDAHAARLTFVEGWAIDARWVRDAESSELLDALARTLYEAKHGKDVPFTGQALDPFGAEHHR